MSEWEDNLRWDTPTTQRETVSQYLPERCREGLRDTVVDAIVAVMRGLALGSEPSWYPDDATDVNVNEPDGLDHTLTHLYWQLLHGKSDETLEVFARLVRDGMDPEDAIRAALMLTTQMA